MLLQESKIRSIIREALLLEGFKSDQKFLLDKYAKNDEVLYKKIEFLDSKQVAWLAPRFGEEIKIREMHVISDCIELLMKFKTRENAINSRWKNRNPAFIAALEAHYGTNVANFPWNNPTDLTRLTYDDLSFLIDASYKEVAKASVDESAPPQELIGKFGPWNVWLPHSMQDSARIAGYDKDTLKPHTTWCTNHIVNQNLFYTYNTDNRLLCYVIRDNPEPVKYEKEQRIIGGPGQFHYFSFGFSGGNLIPGRQGAETIDRDNNGTNEEIWKTHFGEYKDDILKCMHDKVKEIKNVSPSVEMPKKAMQDLNILKGALATLSASKRTDEAERIYKTAAQAGIQFNPACLDYIQDFLSFSTLLASNDPNVVKLVNKKLRKQQQILFSDREYDKIGVIKKLSQIPIDPDNSFAIIKTFTQMAKDSAEKIEQVANVYHDICKSPDQPDETKKRLLNANPFAEVMQTIDMCKSSDPESVRKAEEYAVLSKSNFFADLIGKNINAPLDVVFNILDPGTQLGQKINNTGNGVSARLDQIFKNQSFSSRLNDVEFLETLSPKLKQSIIDAILGHGKKYGFQPKMSIIPYIINNATSPFTLSSFLTNVGLIGKPEIIDLLLASLEENATFRGIKQPRQVAQSLGIPKDRLPPADDDDLNFDELFGGIL